MLIQFRTDSADVHLEAENFLHMLPDLKEKAQRHLAVFIAVKLHSNQGGKLIV